MRKYAILQKNPEINQFQLKGLNPSHYPSILSAPVLLSQISSPDVYSGFTSTFYSVWRKRGGPSVRREETAAAAPAA